MEQSTMTMISSSIARVAEALQHSSKGKTLSLLSSEELRSFVVPKKIMFVDAKDEEVSRANITRLYVQAAKAPGSMTREIPQTAPQLRWVKGWSRADFDLLIQKEIEELTTRKTSYLGTRKNLISNWELSASQQAKLKSQMDEILSLQSVPVKERDKTWEMKFKNTPDKSKLSLDIQVNSLSREKIAKAIDDLDWKISKVETSLDIAKQWVENKGKIPEVSPGNPKITLTVPLSTMRKGDLDQMITLVRMFFHSHRKSLLAQDDWSKVWEKTVLRVLPPEYFVLDQFGRGIPRELTQEESRELAKKRPSNSEQAFHWDGLSALRYYHRLYHGLGARKSNQVLVAPGSRKSRPVIELPPLPKTELEIQKWYGYLVDALSPYVIITSSDVTPLEVNKVQATLAQPEVKPPPPIVEKERPIKTVPSVGKEEEVPATKVAGKEKVPSGNGGNAKARYPAAIRQKAKALLHLAADESAPKWLNAALTLDEAEAEASVKSGTLNAASFNDFVKKIKSKAAKTSSPSTGKKQNENSKSLTAEVLKSQWGKSSKVFRDRKVPLLSDPVTQDQKNYKKLYEEFLEKKKKLPKNSRKSFLLPNFDPKPRTKVQSKEKKPDKKKPEKSSLKSIKALMKLLLSSLE